MAVAAANMLAAAVVLLAASTAGRERSGSDRGSAARDRIRADASRSTTCELYVNAEQFLQQPHHRQQQTEVPQARMAQLSWRQRWAAARGVQP